MSVSVEKIETVLRCTIERSDRGNSLTPDVFAGLLRAYREAEADPAISVIVTRGAGRHFCVGADAADLGQWADRPIGEFFDTILRGRQGLGTHELPQAGSPEDLGMNQWAWVVGAITKPMIAQVRGAAAGGGFSLALLHHFRIGDGSARFATAFGRLGLGAELGLSFTLPRLAGDRRALELQLSGRLVAADEALAIGLLDHVSPIDTLDEDVLAFASTLASKPASARAALDARFAATRDEFQDALRREWLDQQRLWTDADFKSANPARA